MTKLTTTWPEAHSFHVRRVDRCGESTYAGLAGDVLADTLHAMEVGTPLGPWVDAIERWALILDGAVVGELREERSCMLVYLRGAEPGLPGFWLASVPGRR